MSNFFSLLVVPDFPNLSVLKIFTSDHITFLLRIFQWLLVAFMIKVTFLGLSQAHKAIHDLFSIFFIGLTCCLCPYTTSSFSWNFCGVTPAALVLADPWGLFLTPSSSFSPGVACLVKPFLNSPACGLDGPHLCLQTTIKEGTYGWPVPWG